MERELQVGVNFKILGNGAHQFSLSHQPHGVRQKFNIKKFPGTTHKKSIALNGPKIPSGGDLGAF